MATDKQPAVLFGSSKPCTDSGFGNLRHDETYSDLTLLVGDPSNAKHFKVHRAIVCNKSPYIHALCAASPSTTTIPLPNISSELMSTILDYIYTFSLPRSQATPMNIAKMYVEAGELMMEELQAIILAHLDESLKDATAEEVWKHHSLMLFRKIFRATEKDKTGNLGFLVVILLENLDVTAEDLVEKSGVFEALEWDNEKSGLAVVKMLWEKHLAQKKAGTRTALAGETSGEVMDEEQSAIGLALEHRILLLEQRNDELEMLKVNPPANPNKDLIRQISFLNTQLENAEKKVENQKMCIHGLERKLGMKGPKNNPKMETPKKLVFPMIVKAPIQVPAPEKTQASE